MTIDSAVMCFAGCMTLLGLLLSVMFSPYWLLLPTFVGINLIQASFTGFCPPAFLMKRWGMKPGRAFFKNEP